MSTFKELQQRVTTAQSKAQIYQHLIDHLEANFRPVAGAPPKKILLTTEKVPVIDEFFEQVVKELYSGLQTVSAELEQILSMPLTTAPTPGVSVVVPPGTPVVNITSVPVPAPVPVVAPDAKKKSSKSTQGEAQS